MPEGSTESYDPNDFDDLEDAVLWYLQAVENGQPPDVETVLARYPHLREQLLQFLDDEDRLDDWIDPLRTSPPDLPLSEAPLGPFGGYELIDVVGRGGMGVVYEARDCKLNRVVALKMIRPDQILTMTDLQRFRSEAESVARLDHPHIIPIYEVDDHDGRPYFTMKFVEGGTLATRFEEYQLPRLPKERRPGKKQRPPSSQELRGRKAKIAQLVATIADAVHHAHQRRIIHRDMKPGNILLDDGGTPYVSDFGLAIPIQTKSERTANPPDSKPNEKSQDTQQRTNTHRGQIAGTLNYMAPEQAEGRPDLSSAIDVFSLGVILYQLTTGSLPFSEPKDDPADPDVRIRILARVRECKPQKPRERNPRAIDKDLEAICLKCMQRDPKDRYSTALALVEDLNRYQKGKPVRARPVDFGIRLMKSYRRHPVVGTLWGVLVVGLVFGLVGFIWQFRQIKDHLVKSQRSQYQLGVGTAYRELKQGRLEHAKKLLRACPENLRNWEWNFLNRWAQGNVVYSPEQESEVRVVACSPNGKLIASASYLGVIKLWDYKTLSAVASAEQPGPIDSLVFSPDGRWIVTACSLDKKIRVWQISPGNRNLIPVSVPQKLAHPEGEVLAFHPKGHLLAVGGGYNQSALALWSFREGKLIQDTRIENCGIDEIFSLSFCVRGSEEPLLYVGGSGEDLRAYRVPTLEERGDRNITTKTLCYALATDPKGRYVATLTQGTASFWDTKTRREFHLPTSVNHALCKGIMFSHTGEYLAGMFKGTITVWSVPQGRRLFDVQRSDTDLNGLAFHPDDEVLVFPAGKRFGLEYWKSSNALAVKTFQDSTTPVQDIAFGPGGRHLATVSGDGKVYLRDVSSGLGKSQKLKLEDIVSIAFNPWDGSLACGSKDGKVLIWDVPTAKRRLSFVAHSGPVTDLIYQSENRLITSSEDKTIRIWDLANTQQACSTISSRSPINAMAWSRRLKTLAVGGDILATLQRYDLSRKDWKDLGQRGPPAKDVRSLAYSAGQSLLATADVKGCVILWDARTGQHLRELTGHSGAVYDVAFTADGKRLVSAGLDGTVKIWSTETGQEILNLEAFDRDPFTKKNFGHRAAHCLALDPNGGWLAVGHDDGTVILRDGRP